MIPGTLWELLEELLVQQPVPCHTRVRVVNDLIAEVLLPCNHEKLHQGHSIKGFSATQHNVLQNPDGSLRITVRIVAPCFKVQTEKQDPLRFLLHESVNTTDVACMLLGVELLLGCFQAFRGISIHDLAPTKAEGIAAFEQPKSCHVSRGVLRVVHQGGNRHSPGRCGSQPHRHSASRGVAGGRGVQKDYLRR